MKPLIRIRSMFAAAALSLVLGVPLSQADDEVRAKDDADTRMNKADLTESLSESSATKKSKKAEKKAERKARKKAKKKTKRAKKKEKKKAKKKAEDETTGNDNNRQTVRGTDL